MGFINGLNLHVISAIFTKSVEECGRYFSAISTFWIWSYSSTKIHQNGYIKTLILTFIMLDLFELSVSCADQDLKLVYFEKL